MQDKKYVTCFLKTEFSPPELTLEDLYFQKLEENAEQDVGGSGLGYLTLMKDYGIRFGFRFRTLNTETTAVDVQAHVSLRDTT